MGLEHIVTDLNGMLIGAMPQMAERLALSWQEEVSGINYRQI